MKTVIALSKRIAWAWLTVVITAFLGALLAVAGIAAVQHPWRALGFCVLYAFFIFTWACVMRVAVEP